MQMCLQESNEVHLSALGVAMSSLVTVAEILKALQLVVVKSLGTMLERFNDRIPQAQGVWCCMRWLHTLLTQLEIILEKSEQFDSVIAEDAHRESDLQLSREQGVPEEDRGVAN